MNRIAIFTRTRAYSARKGIAELMRAFPETEWLLVEYAPRKSLRQIIRRYWRNFRKNRRRRIPRQAVLPASLGKARSKMAPRISCCAWEAIAAGNGVKRLCVDDIHDEAVLAEVRRFDPDLGISLAAPILKPSLFRIPRPGTINLHKGNLSYRGTQAEFWELYDDDAEMGCTILRLERTLNTRAILIERTLERKPYSTPRGMQIALEEIGVNMLLEAVRASRYRFDWKPPTGDGREFPKPTPREKTELAQECVLPVR